MASTIRHTADVVYLSCSSCRQSHARFAIAPSVTPRCPRSPGLTFHIHQLSWGPFTAPLAIRPKRLEVRLLVGCMIELCGAKVQASPHLCPVQLLRLVNQSLVHVAEHHEERLASPIVDGKITGEAVVSAALNFVYRLHAQSRTGLPSVRVLHQC